MSQHQTIHTDPENSSPRMADRRQDIEEWSRERSEAIASEEGVDMTEEHWKVVTFLRRHYLEHGLADNARELAEELDQEFAEQGGRRHLRRLFPEGPVSQGSRIACLPVPPYNEDASFGTAF
ncbi:MAG: TusE/DsrC/DsvC family sulfur relay protein [Gammaproteobacteria bacterium]|nr:TusE/DsrC/DsvC family sulfur relay protein [Gammaproteobacteria bacterium]